MPVKDEVPFEPHQINHWAWNHEVEPIQVSHAPLPNPSFGSWQAVHPDGARSSVVRAFADLHHGSTR